MIILRITLQIRCKALLENIPVIYQQICKIDVLLDFKVKVIINDYYVKYSIHIQDKVSFQFNCLFPTESFNQIL